MNTVVVNVIGFISHFFRMLFFFIIGPTLTMCMFCLAYGRDLKDLRVYYTNNDIREYCDNTTW